MLTLHILGATVWTGGHLVLAVCVLPNALRRGDAQDVRRFEHAYEKLGIPALALQVVTGLWLAFRLIPSGAAWLDGSNPVTRLVWIKLGLLALTALLGLDARLRLIPKLHAGNLRALAWHIVPVTVVSVLFVIVGAAFRTGWLF